MKDVEIGQPEASERQAIHALVAKAFGQLDEAELVDRLVAEGLAVLELVARTEARIDGHVLFCRLQVKHKGTLFPAVALAPLCVDASSRRRGVGAALVEAGHGQLKKMGETLSIVVGDPAYYSRFGYSHARAEAFASAYQGEALQALAWGDAPTRGRLVYPKAFAEF